MTMFDDYIPAGDYACPVCNTLQTYWQGYEGPCGLCVFREGVKGAVEQPVVEECQWSRAELEEILLPDEFSIYAYDCK